MSNAWLGLGLDWDYRGMGGPWESRGGPGACVVRGGSLETRLNLGISGRARQNGTIASTQGRRVLLVCHFGMLFGGRRSVLIFSRAIWANSCYRIRRTHCCKWLRDRALQTPGIVGTRVAGLLVSGTTQGHGGPVPWRSSPLCGGRGVGACVLFHACAPSRARAQCIG